MRFAIFLTLAACDADRVGAKNSFKNSADSASSAAAAEADAEARTQGEPAASADPKLVADVARDVAAKNASEPKAFDALAADGWSLVENVPAPEPGELAYSPDLLISNADVLRVQLASTTPPSEAVASVETIALQSSGDMRLTAIGALGRVHSSDAIASLTRLIARFTDDEEARRTAAPLLIPSSLQDASVSAIAALLESNVLGEVEKNQIAFNLAAVGLRDNSTLSLPLSSSAAERIAKMRALIQQPQ